jgi:membrane associated rhomboid family serine protease
VKQKQHPFGSSLEAIVYPTLILMVIWFSYLADYLTEFNATKLGVLPRTLEGVKGIVFMPFVHAPKDFNHIINNSLPFLLLSSAVIYFYREIALKVIVLAWLFSGFGVWFFAVNHGSYHIGVSGVIYALASFVFVSGVLRKFLPLQAMALFVSFLYGGMIWGLFPTNERISWEGHLSGFIIGALLAYFYRKQGPQVPKYQFEIEKELGIPPPDLEGEYWAKVRAIEEQQRLQEQAEKQTSSQGFQVVYDYKPDKKTNAPNDND